MGPRPMVAGRTGPPSSGLRRSGEVLGTSTDRGHPQNEWQLRPLTKMLWVADSNGLDFASPPESRQHIHQWWTSDQRAAVASAGEDAAGVAGPAMFHGPWKSRAPSNSSASGWWLPPLAGAAVRKSRPAERGTTIDWLATSSPGCPDPSRRPRGAEGATEGPIRGSKLQQRDFGSLSPRSGSLNPARPAAPVALPLNEGLSPAYVVAQSSASPSLAAVPRLDVVSRHSVGLSPIGRRYATPAGGSTLAH
jgi:hypothetical protein